MLALLLATAVATASPVFTVKEVAPGVFAAITDPNAEPGSGNAGFVVGSESVLAVDAFADAAAAQKLIEAIRARTPLPIRFAVLTHFHTDHVGGSSAWKQAGAVIVAHDNVRAWIRREWQPDRPPERRALDRALPLPDVTFGDAISIDLGGRRVDVVHREGHSGSDAVVGVPDAKVIFTGDLFSRRCIPGVDYARIDPWIGTLDAVLRESPDSLFVPGHGEPGRALDVRGFRDYLSSLRQDVARAIGEGLAGDALVEKVRTQLATRYKSWSGFGEVGRNIVQTERELKGTKAYPPEPPR